MQRKTARESLAYSGLVAFVALAAAAGPVVAQNPRPGGKLEQMRKLRKEAAQRRRRLIFNNDGDEPVYQCKEPTVEALLKARTTGLAGTNVDSIFYCTWSSGFGMFTHHTKIGEVFTCKNKPFNRNLTQEFMEQGIDPLQVMVDFCRDNGIEIFWSMRMNDVHDGSYPDMVPQWKKDHPRLLFGSRDKRPPAIGDGRVWSGVNYGRQEVRDRAFAFIQEVCENYDIDGIEMDFFRHPVFFRSHAWGRRVNQRERDDMTALLRRVRDMTEQVSLKKWHPILIAVRVPDSVGYCREIGLDLERWLQEGLVDLLIPGGYFRLQPWKVSVELGHKYGVMVYPALDESRMKKGGARNKRESYRARAMNVWNSGADGVYVYNFNYYAKPNDPVWKELGEPEKLQTLDKTYYLRCRGFWGIKAYLRSGEQFHTLPTLSPERPVTLKAGESYSVEFPVGDNVQWGKQQGTVPELKLRLQVKNLKDPEEVTVTLNNQALAKGALSEGWLEYAPPAELVKQGANKIGIAFQGGNKAGLIVSDLLLQIAYKQSG